MPTSRIAIALAVATTLVAGKAASQALPRAHVTGHVMDGSGGVVPGARVTVRAIGMRRQVTSDAAGQFDVADVPPGSYVVTAELAGFEAAVRKVIVTTPDSMVDVSLTVSIEFCHRDLVVDRGFRDTAIESDAILHVRITGVAPTRGIKKGCSADADTFTATVLEGITVRAEDADQSTIRWVQDLDSPGPRTGQEYLIFLTWDAANSRYSAAEGLYVFPVRADRVEWNRDDAPGIRNGDPVAHVTDAIRGVLAPLRNGR